MIEINKIVVFSVIALLFWKCKKENFESNISGKRGELILFKKVASMTTQDIINVNSNEHASQVWKDYLEYSIDLYTITYKSLYKNKLVELSGLVAIPKTSDSLSILQYHHGTMLPIPTASGEGVNDAPSLYEGTGPKSDANFYETRLLCLTMASNGYIMTAPDYAGYNVSKNLNHPYTFHKELANSSIDMLRASKQLIKKLNVKFTERIFLTGWSEGGGATIATQKYIEEFFPTEFNIVANSSFAGPHDYDAFAIDVFKKKDRVWPELVIYSWAGFVWNEFGNINRPNDQIWNYQVNDPIEALNLPSNIPSKVFRPFMMENIINGSDKQMLDVIKENDLIENWKPGAKIFFHHGKKDRVVLFFNSENAHNTFESIGVDTELYGYEGDHYTPVFDYLSNTLDDFNDLN